jgi:transcriptional regulator with XRE-family HTH domain
MNFQEKLQVLRKEKGLSQENLAEQLGLSRQAVAKWEVGQSYPDINNLIALSDFFRISIDKLVKDIEACSINAEKSVQYNSSEDIIDFLRRAKKSTYAGKGAEVLSSRPGSHDLHYAEGDLIYIDTYLGSEKFAGEEAIWKADEPFWSMNYVGRIIAEGFSGDFLKEVLFNVPKEYPFRGPMLYQKGEYTYHCIVNGDFEWFNGYEEIFYNSIRVYECMFHGGCIK